jgi:mRNA-degrading endonuclease toxin of MazEF toxin-antitoxin module
MKVVVADITSSSRDRAFPTAVEVDPSEENRFSEISYVCCHELATIRRTLLDADPIGQLSPADLHRVRQCIEMVIGTRAFPQREGYEWEDA